VAGIMAHVQPALTRREIDVLVLIAQGKQTKEIATALNLSVHTVADYRKHICKKLALHSTATLVAYAIYACPPVKGD
jgi:DNA-binding CsgD family transcriptional regulator